MTILSFDPSSTTNLGYAALTDGELVDSGVATVHDMTDVHDAVLCLIATHHPDIICWESTVGSGGFAVTRTRIAQTSGVIRYLSERHGIRWIEVSGPHAAKVVLGTGRPGKTRTKHWFRDTYRPDARRYADISVDENGHENVEHVADATMIGLSVAMEVTDGYWIRHDARGGTGVAQGAARRGRRQGVRHLADHR